MERIEAPPVDLGAALREARESLGWPTTKVAYLSGTTENAVYKIETGRSQPTGATLRALMLAVPGFAERLGFQVIAHAA